MLILTLNLKYFVPFFVRACTWMVKTSGSWRKLYSSQLRRRRWHTVWDISRLVPILPPSWRYSIDVSDKKNQKAVVNVQRPPASEAGIYSQAWLRWTQPGTDRNEVSLLAKKFSLQQFCSQLRVTDSECSSVSTYRWCLIPNFKWSQAFEGRFWKCLSQRNNANSGWDFCMESKMMKTTNPNLLGTEARQLTENFFPDIYCYKLNNTISITYSTVI